MNKKGGRHKPVKNGREVEKILARNGCSFRRAKGSHAIGTLPDGSKMTYHYHGNYGTGIARKITKSLLRAGLVFVLVFCILPYL
jgi:predicted RNA binding protein YcfA (HicA-like mRNA interferase family)